MELNEEKKFVSILIPAHNEEAILNKNLSIIYEYMNTLTDKYEWEIIIVNDGSKDNTGKLADEFSVTHENIHVYHHKVNQNLGSALQTGFDKCNGDYIVTLDLDLSYSPDHIEQTFECHY